MSRPSRSTSGVTRIDLTLFTTPNTTYVAPNAQAAQRVAPASWTEELPRVAVEQASHTSAGLPR